MAAQSDNGATAASLSAAILRSCASCVRDAPRRLHAHTRPPTGLTDARARSSATRSSDGISETRSAGTCMSMLHMSMPRFIFTAPVHVDRGACAWGLRGDGGAGGDIASDCETVRRRLLLPPSASAAVLSAASAALFGPWAGSRSPFARTAVSPSLSSLLLLRLALGPDKLRRRYLGGAAAASTVCGRPCVVRVALALRCEHKARG
eukprot:365425-Chlamydomonas_euryale.AAC.17